MTYTGTVREVDRESGSVTAEIVSERRTGEAVLEGEVVAELPSRSDE